MALLDDLANANKFQVRLQSKFLAGRCLWLSDNEKDQKQARQLWDQFDKDRVDWKPGPVYLAIAKALILESDGDEAQAIRTLESAIARNVRNVCTPEAQIELARLLARTGRVEEAKQQLAAGEDLLNRETKVEMNKAEAAPYYVAIQKTRDGLKYDANPGLAEVEQADKLRSDKKFAQAGRLYEQILKDWPKSESADRATVGMGHCLLAMGKSVPAADLWRKFIAAAPAARWRGQATTALLDMGLEGQLPWEETRKLAAWAETTLPTALADDKAKPSWQSAAYSLHLQLAAIHWMSGQYEPAGAALDQCIKLSDGDRAKRLSSLADVVRQKKSLLPEGVVGSSVGSSAFRRSDALSPANPAQLDPASVVLSMAVIQALAEQYDSSARFAHFIADAKLPATPSQRGFPTFLLICLDDTVAPAASAAHLPAPLTIDQRYLQLTKAYPDAPWLDEVIYRLAARNDKTAEKATDTDPLELKGSKNTQSGSGVSPLNKPAEDLFTDNQVPPVLALYRDLATRYPKSPRRERALWRFGRICLDTGRADEADQAFQTQCQDYPQGPYAGDALVRLLDVALEYRFDLPAAKKLADGAVQWAGVERTPASDAAMLEPWRMLGRFPSLPVDGWVKYELYLRAGFLAYLNEDFAAAKSLFDKGGPAHPQGNRPVEANTSGISLYLMVKACEKKWVPWDSRAVDACKTDAQRVAIKLADCYIYSARSDRGLVIYRRILGKDPNFLPLTGDLEAYATWKLALAYAEGPREISKAMELYGRFYHPPFSKSPWVPDAILRLGVLTNNNTPDRSKAMQHYQFIATRYPDHPLAEKAMYFYCICAIQSGNQSLARKAAEEFLQRYAGSPNSHWRQDVIDSLKALEKQFSEKTDRERKAR